MIKETLYANSYKEMDFGDSGVACQWHGRQREVVRHSQSNHLLTLTPPPPGVKLYYLSCQCQTILPFFASVKLTTFP